MKKIISMVLVLAMSVIALTACGNNTETNNAANTTNNVEETAETAETEETTEAGAVFKIGATGPITGGAAVYGQAVMNGATLAVDEINAAGGINGTQIEFNFQDDEHDAEKVINAYNSLMDWEMQILMGTVTSTPCLAVKEETYVDRIFQLTPSGSAVDCVTYDNAFAVCFSDPNQGIASAQYIADHDLASKVAVIYDSSDVYSSGIYAKFAAKAEELGIEIVAAEAFTADSKSDFTTQLQIVKEAEADLVFLPIYYNEAALILSQAATAGYDPVFFGCDGLDGILSVEGFDTTLAEGVMLLTPFAADATDDLTVNFVTAFEAAYGETPNQFAADGYDAIYIIKAAIEEAGVTVDMSNEEICDMMSAAMSEISVDGTTGLAMTWAETGEVNKAPVAVVIEDGSYTIFE